MEDNPNPMKKKPPSWTLLEFSLLPRLGRGDTLNPLNIKNPNIEY